MSSQALYRKWRSQNFDDLVGQGHIVQALRNAIGANRIGHAYLFTGPRGVGKTSAARILAKAVNCEDRDPQARPCSRCAACVAVAEGRAVDVIEMDAASHTSVDDAREIIERVQFRPTQFRVKVYIIDEIHMLSTAAFNALLKTLEEPPDHAMFIMATTEFHKVPATIISRCQRFVFNRHTVQDTAAHLEWIAGQEGVRLEAGVGEAIARAATGSMRDAVSVLDQLIGYGDAAVPLSRVQSLLGATSAQEVQTLVDALADGDVALALRVINGVADQGADLRQFTRDTVTYLRGLMLLKSNGDPDLLDVGRDTLQAMDATAQRLDLAAILGWLKVFSNLDHQLRTSPYGQLPLEMAVVEALVAPAARPQESAIQPPKALVRQAPSRHAAPAQPAEAPRRPAARPADSAAPEPTREAHKTTSRAGESDQDLSGLRGVSQTRGRTSPLDANSAPSGSEDSDQFPHLAQATSRKNTLDDNQGSAPAGGLSASGPAPLDATEPANADPAAFAPTPAPAATEWVAQAVPPVEDEHIVFAESEVVLAEIESLWPQIIEDLKPYNPRLQAVLKSCDPTALEDTMLVIGSPSPFHTKQLEDQANRRLLEDIISKKLSRTILVRSEQINKEQQSKTRDARRQREELMKDQIVKAARNIFDARIVGVQEDG